MITLIIINLGHLGSQHKIENDKFDGTNNFNMWHIEVTHTLMAANLEDTIELVVNPRGIRIGFG